MLSLEQAMQEFRPHIVGFSLRNVDTCGSKRDWIEYNAELIALAKQHV